MTEREHPVRWLDHADADLGKSIFPVFAVNAPMPRNTAVPAPQPEGWPNPGGAPPPPLVAE